MGALVYSWAITISRTCPVARCLREVIRGIAAFSAYLSFGVFSPLYGGLAAGDAEGAGSPWHLASRGMVEEAHAAFSGMAGTGVAERESRFGLAITLLNLQPKTNRNIEKAYAVLGDLLEEDSSDRFGIASRYFLGRIDQIHRVVPDEKAARRHFLDLIEHHVEHPYAQLAIVKLGILDVYDPENKNIASVIADTEAHTGLLVDRIAKRDFHILLAKAIERFELPKRKSLDHLLAAQVADPAIARLDPGFTLHVADLARELGEHGRAVRHYREFLRNFRQDSRRYQVEQTLASLVVSIDTNEFSATE